MKVRFKIQCVCMCACVCVCMRERECMRRQFLFKSCHCFTSSKRGIQLPGLESNYSLSV